MDKDQGRLSQASAGQHAYTPTAKANVSVEVKPRLRILYVASEVSPFLKLSSVADFVKQLPLAMQERGLEIRILVPRFGLINERKNRLHEVVRLSGLNISMGDQEKSLVIKVASMPNARMQVYFIDNEDYFKRKSVFFDKNDVFHSDNDERAIFFCKGVLATVRRLGWSPDIIHCNDWMTSFIPLYVKTTYRNDPFLCNTKCIFSVHDPPKIKHSFEKKKLFTQAKMLDVEDEMLSPLSTGCLNGLAHLGIFYADVVIGGKRLDNELLRKEAEKKEAIEVESAEDLQPDRYYALYVQLVSERKA